MSDVGDSVRFGLVLPNWEARGDVGRLVDAAVAAEESGWDGVFLADHLIFPPPGQISASSSVTVHQDMPDPWIVLSAIAVKTRRIRLGTWITPVGRRQPWQVARDVATLDRLSGGRVILGAGLGRRPDYEQFGLPWSMKWSAKRCDEALDVISGLWSGQSVTFHGEHFTLDEVVLLPTPIQSPRVPVVIGGLWPKKPAVRRGARWDGIMTHFPGDGVLSEEMWPSHGGTPEHHATEMVAFYRSLAGEHGDVFLPMAPPGASQGWVDLCIEVGATWLYTAKVDGEWTLDVDRIGQGPKSQLS